MGQAAGWIALDELCGHGPGCFGLGLVEWIDADEEQMQKRCHGYRDQEGCAQAADDLIEIEAGDWRGKTRGIQGSAQSQTPSTRSRSESPRWRSIAAALVSGPKGTTRCAGAAHPPIIKASRNTHVALKSSLSVCMSHGSRRQLGGQKFSLFFL